MSALKVKQYSSMEIEVGDKKFLFRYDTKDGTSASLSSDGGSSWFDAKQVNAVLATFKDVFPFAFEEPTDPATPSA